MSVLQEKQYWRFIFILAALEAGAAFVLLASVPREAAGYSVARLAMLAILLSSTVASLAAAWRPPAFVESLLPSTAALLAAAVVVGSGTALFLLRYLHPIELAPYYRRMGIVLWYLLAVGIQALLVPAVTWSELPRRLLNHFRSPLRAALVALALLMLVLLVIMVTSLGVTPDPAYWGEPGVPIFGWQLAFGLLVAAVVLLGAGWLRQLRSRDAWIAVGLWVLAAGIWMAVPLRVMQNSFYAPIGPPAYEAYPNSDAGYYDSMAESLLIGHPYQGDIPARPLYIAFLTVLHLVFGQHYDAIILGQTLVLALIPVALYLLGARLHSRAAGVLVALLAIAREWNSLLVASQTRVSNTKTLLVDLPTALLVIATCGCLVRWVRSRDLRGAMLCGGMFGLLLLLRTQAVVILPFLLLIGLLGIGGPRRIRALQLGAFGLLLALTILPWLVHNYLSSGQLVFDAPFQYRIIASQYQYSGNLDIGNVSLEGKGLLAGLVGFALRDPLFVLRFVLNHTLATQVGGLLALPLIEPYNGLLAEINLYWLTWDGALSWYNFMLVLAYLVVIAIGLGAAWRYGKWAGIAPLGFSLSYSLANGIARFSGWRYDLPADWVWYFYFGIGAIEILSILAIVFSRGTWIPAKNEPAPSRVPRSLAASSALIIPLFVLIGALPWLLEGISRPHYANQSVSALVAAVESAPSYKTLNISEQELETFLERPGAVIQRGSVLYPRFFIRDTGLASAHPWPAYAPRDFPRLGFLLLNEASHDVVLRSREPLAELVHAGDAIVVGCDAGSFIDARLVWMMDSGRVFRGPALEDSCR